MKLKLLVNLAAVAIINTLSLMIVQAGELDNEFRNLFVDVLVNRLQLSPEGHGNHFIESAQAANADLTPGLSSLIANEVSSFPLSSTSVGVTFDFSTGEPIKIIDSLGPIFAENAETLGRGKFNIGFNNTILTLDQFRGLDLDDIRFTFAHQDIPITGILGDNPNESDTLDLLLDLDVDANISAFYGSYGLTENFDVGIAIPVVHVDIGGSAKATINSFTFAQSGVANHRFGIDQETGEPILDATVPYGDDAFGIGDVALRFKYGFLKDFDVNLAFLLDIRLPTGDEDDFLGTGDTNIKLTEIFSKNIGDTTVRVNLSYERRSADLDSDEIEFVVGFDHKLNDALTVAFDVLGDFDLNDDEAINLFPGSEMIVDRSGPDDDEDGVPDNTNTRIVDLSNVPSDDKDNEVNLSVGFRYAPSERYNLLANILLPLNDDGLRSEVTPTFGISVNF